MASKAACFSSSAQLFRRVGGVGMWQDEVVVIVGGGVEVGGGVVAVKVFGCDVWGCGVV